MSVIHTVFICDNDYCIQTSVALVSMKENMHTSSIYHNHILCCDVDIKNIEKLKSISENNFLIDIIETNVEKYKTISDQDTSYLVATKAALLKFDIPNILNFNKVLYLDGDIIVKKDLTVLYNISLDNHYAAVVPDLPQVLYDKPLFDMGNGRKYFNTGMMLLNLKRMRKHNVTKRLIDTKIKLTNDKLMDQNVFNIVFSDDIKIVAPIYNLTYLNLKRSEKKYKMSDMNEMFDTAYSSLDELLRDSYIIHFSSKDKPWIYYDVPQADEWLYYFNRSPYGDLNLQRYSKNISKVYRKGISIFEENVIPIVMASDDIYIKNLCVTLQSIKKYKKDDKYNIYILYIKLNTDNINKVLSMENEDVKITFIKLDGLHGSVYSVGHYSVDMYSRWFIPELFYHHKKVLYIDCDTICCTDIKNIFDIDLDDYIVGACINNQFSEKANYRERVLGINSNHYINSGVLLINTRKFIKLNLKNKLFDFIQNNKKLECPDQDALNVVAKNSIKIIDYRWNVQWHHNFMPGKGSSCFDVDYYEKCLHDPYILHYTSNIKPWIERHHPGADRFWNLAKDTPFYKELLRGEKVGMATTRKESAAAKKSVITNLDVLEIMKLFRMIMQESGVMAKIPMSSIDVKFLSRDYRLRIFFYALKQGDTYAAEHILQEMYKNHHDAIISEYENRIKKIYHSPSMIITRPLRWFIKIFKK